MDKIFSTRIDEAVVQKIATLSQTLGMSKKAVIEDAITQYIELLDKKSKLDVFDQTCGTWHREETPQETVKKAKNAFQSSMQRHHT